MVLSVLLSGCLALAIAAESLPRSSNHAFVPSSIGQLTQRSRGRSRLQPLHLTQTLFPWLEATKTPVLDRRRNSREKSRLMELLGEDAGDGDAADESGKQREIEDLVDQLVAGYVFEPDAALDDLCGVWKLLYTYAPGSADVQFASLDSWRRYFFEKAPSPLQALATNNPKNTYQVLDLKEANKFSNLVDFSEGSGLIQGILCIEAEYLGLEDSRLNFIFDNGFIALKPSSDDSPSRRLPYPVPFKLLGDKAKGYLDVLYVDDTLRVAKGNRGTIFVFRHEGNEAVQRLRDKGRLDDVL
ncbi:unnamed protein product [Vitrella brassicaformis CCMP3155]|uniref:Plastid lipid-associated protein/fibrillin conserved domain-containing protein n=1 Tax=Vitrella brassicaformis (strain CCMP3155) TaxID=1169540 RepID=A0A0G4F1Q0_VITBC|nr:unnamed protein product [Vitrella brassicaformis CCMP3155]|mmetsp:Transcript_32948/g.81592  ORF Transcript_32948/g.81592 Transcript_32948/m.81592 type:complete len:299 (-) Transcript_32948:1075-1971(-)|eukprot:CEM05655.1 unnamed protein product [Vitrella brassicaformis CCMP3155]